MTEEARKARAAYKKKWAKEHPDKIRAQQERYWEKRAKEEAGEGQQAAPEETPAE